MSTIYTTEWMNALSIHHPFCYGLTDILDFANLCDHVLLNTQDILHIKLDNTAIEEVYRTHKPLGVRGELDTTTNIMSVLHRIVLFYYKTVFHQLATQHGRIKTACAVVSIWSTQNQNIVNSTWTDVLPIVTRVTQHTLQPGVFLYQYSPWPHWQSWPF